MPLFRGLLRINLSSENDAHMVFAWLLKCAATVVDKKFRPSNGTCLAGHRFKNKYYAIPKPYN